MCEICGKYLCPPACPSYVGDSAERGRRVCFCALCGAPICEYDYVGYKYGNPYCYSCYSDKYEQRDYKNTSKNS